MKKIFFLLAILHITIMCFAQPTTGTRLTAPIVPNDSADVYPTHYEGFGLGGYRSVKTLTKRNNIAAGYRNEGMLVKVLDDSKIYQLTGGLTNANWSELNFSSNIYWIKLDSVLLNYKIGRNAINTTGTGINNMTIGDSTLSANTTGYNNTAIGNSALSKNTTGILNTAIGSNTLRKNTTGNYNCAIGANSMLNSTTGDYNIGIGNSALQELTTGKNNMAIGSWALNKTTIGVNNTAIGTSALISLTTGSYNCAIGNASQLNNISGPFNVSIGNSSLINNKYGSSNTVMGYGALRFSGINSNNNTIIGYNCMKNDTGQNNVAIGFQAGNSNIVGNYNVFLGSNAGYYEMGSNKLYITNKQSRQPLIYGTFNTDTVRINGNLAVKDTATGKIIHFTSKGTGTSFLSDDGTYTPSGGSYTHPDETYYSAVREHWPDTILDSYFGAGGGYWFDIPLRNFKNFASHGDTFKIFKCKIAGVYSVTLISKWAFENTPPFKVYIKQFRTSYPDCCEIPALLMSVSDYSIIGSPLIPVNSQETMYVNVGDYLGLKVVCNGGIDYTQLNFRAIFLHP